MNLDRAIEYLAFVTERHRVWERRQEGCQQPWTEDPILAHHKFTNVFRVLDPGSQFVLTDLLPDTTPEEFLFRCFLYRHTGRVEAWRYLDLTVGYPRGPEDLPAVKEAWTTYRGGEKMTWGRSNRGDGQQVQRRMFDRSVFTGAYLVFPQSTTPGTDKLTSILDLTARLSRSGVFSMFVEQPTQIKRFNTLRQEKGVADFMSMQVLTDFGYSTEFRENDFVVPGPGARKGAAALEMPPDAAIRWAHETLLRSSDCPVVFDPEDINAHLKPSLMDVQNTLCEFSKYVRFADKGAPTSAYRPAHPGAQLPPVLPPKW